MKETNFKDTEIGKIPHDWKIYILEELFNFGNGYTPSKSNPDFWHNGTIPWFRMEDIRLNGRILKDSIQHITKEAVKQNLFPAYSIILSTTATIGEHALLIADSLANQQFTFLYRKVNRTSEIDIMFFYYHCFILGNWCRKNMNEGGLLAVNIDDLKNYTFALPSLKEQQRIATVLSDVDNLITSLDKLIEKKKLIKQGTMQDLLSGKKRLKGFNDNWQTVKLGDVADIIKGSGLSKSKITEKGGYDCILYGEIFTKYQYVAKENFSKTNSIEGFLSEYGDVIMPGSTTTKGIDLAKAICVLQKNVRLGGDIIIIRNSYNLFNSLFLAYYITEVQKKGIEEIAQGITIIHLQSKFLFNFSLTIPVTIEEQKEIAKILTDMDEEINALQNKKAKYINIKQAMMQELLTGRIRLI